MVEGQPALRWWTRGPSARSWLILAVPVALTAAAGWLWSPWILAVSALAGAVEVWPRWWRSETAWRRRYERVPEAHPVHHDVAEVATRFGLLRRPAVLLVDDLGSPAAAVDTAHPGATVLVSPQLLDASLAGSFRSVQAVLAHELSHLHRFHVPVMLLQHALTTTAALATTIAALLEVTPAFHQSSPGGLLWRAAGVVLLWLLKPALTVVQAHVCELDADRDAARLGYGRELAALFGSARTRKVVRRGLLSHPHPRRRAAALARFDRTR